MIRFELRHAFAGMALDIGFDAPARGVTALFGPSGAGKSSVISAMAGLFRARTVRFSVGDTVLADTERAVWVPPEARRLGVVFQDSRLFPHMDVAGNLRYGARRAGPGPILFDEVVGLLGIAALMTRRPHSLSGGERQRVAIGRALLSQPRLLLMDEPLAGLDAARKSDILPYLSALKSLSLPIVYVTHALDELVRLADHLVLLEAGRVRAVGTLEELAGRADLPLAVRDDAGAVLTLNVASHNAVQRLTTLNGSGITLLVPLLSVTGQVRLRIPAREVILATRAPEEISLHNIVAGRVRTEPVDAIRHTAMVEVLSGSASLLARVTPDAVTRLGLSPGAPVLALIKSSSIDVIAS